jgi:lantibiotic biosynthesis protein
MITLPSPEEVRGAPSAPEPVAPVEPVAATVSPAAPLGRDDVLAAVVDIVATLHDQALSHDGRTLWLGDEVEPVGSSHQVVHRACGGSMYDGTAGIGWFLAHAAAATDDELARRDALGALRHALDAAGPDSSLGFFEGSTGIGWAALDGGLALEDPIAAEGLDLLLDTVLRSATVPLFDELIAGRAGVILAALSGAELAANRMGRPTDAGLLRDGAIELGRQVLAAAYRSPTGWTWPSAIGGDDEPPLCSLGHGLSGPILATAHLAALTGDAAFAEAARQGARAERAWLRVEEGWPDLRGFDRVTVERGDRPVFPFLWCHGAGGIGLSRIRAARLLDDPTLLADATIALHLAASEVPRLWQATPGTYAANFSLCHGAAGLVELFNAAARELGDRSWLGAAAGVAQAGLAARAAGIPWTCGVRDGTDSASLMLGLAGTGTALLRLASPDAMPSPLTIGPEPSGASLLA